MWWPFKKKPDYDTYEPDRARKGKSQKNKDTEEGEDSSAEFQKLVDENRKKKEDIRRAEIKLRMQMGENPADFLVFPEVEVPTTGPLPVIPPPNNRESGRPLTALPAPSGTSRTELWSQQSSGGGGGPPTPPPYLPLPTSAFDQSASTSQSTTGRGGPPTPPPYPPLPPSGFYENTSGEYSYSDPTEVLPAPNSQPPGGSSTRSRRGGRGSNQPPWAEPAGWEEPHHAWWKMWEDPSQDWQDWDPTNKKRGKRRKQKWQGQQRANWEQMTSGWEGTGEAGENVGEVMGGMKSVMTGGPLAIAQLALKRYEKIKKELHAGFHEFSEGMADSSFEGTVGHAGQSIRHQGKALGIEPLTEPIAKMADVIAGTIGTLRKWGDALHETNQKFAEFSGAMAGVQARQMVRDISLSKERGDRRARWAEPMEKKRHEFNKEMGVWEDKFDEIKARILEPLLVEVTTISKWVRDKFGIESASDKDISDFREQVGEGFEETDPGGFLRPRRFPKGKHWFDF